MIKTEKRMKKKGRVAITLFVVLTFLALCFGISLRHAFSEELDKGDFNFIFKYGIEGKNILDTFQGTLTQDTNPEITIKLYLTEYEMRAIYKKMVEIGFFNYPDIFSLEDPRWNYSTRCSLHSHYYFKVKHKSQIKELSWDDATTCYANMDTKKMENEKANNLLSLIRFIEHLIDSKAEVKRIPYPRAMYE